MPDSGELKSLKTLLRYDQWEKNKKPAIWGHNGLWSGFGRQSSVVEAILWIARTGTVFGVDLAKRVFQVRSIDPGTGEITSKQVKRSVFPEQFVNRSPCLIGMEACGGAQHWAGASSLWFSEKEYLA